MRLPRWVNNLLQPSRKMDTLELWKEIYGGRETWAGRTITIDSALRTAAVLGCARVICEGVAMLPWKVYRVQGRNLTAATDHPLYALVAHRPNPVQSSYEFVETMMLHLVLCGGAFVWTPRVGTRRQLDQLWLFDPGWITVKGEFGQSPTYELRLPGRTPVFLQADEVWHVRALSWANYHAMEPVQMAREVLGLGMALEEGQARMVGRGQRGSGYISVDGVLNDNQHKQITAWLERSGGVANADKPLILDRAAKWVGTSLTNIDAQTLEQRRFQIEEVCRIMRVSPLMVGHTTAGTSTYGTVEQLFIAHDKHTIGPWVRRVELAADARLLSVEDVAQGYYTKFNEKALTRMTAVDQMSYLDKAVRAGIMSRNEAREKLELNPIDGQGLDDYQVSAPVAPVEGGNA